MEETKQFCDVCKTSFVRNYFLVQHLKTKKHLSRVTNKDFQFVCACGKTYLHRHTLENHKNKCKDDQLEKIRLQLESHLKESGFLDKKIDQLLEQKPTIIQTIETQNNIHNNITI